MVVPKGAGLSPLFLGMEKGGLCAIESGHITTTAASKKTVHPVDYGHMGRGRQSPPQGPHRVVWPTVLTMSLALGL